MCLSQVKNYNRKVEGFLKFMLLRYSNFNINFANIWNNHKHGQPFSSREPGREKGKIYSSLTSFKQSSPEDEQIEQAICV